MTSREEIERLLNQTGRTPDEIKKTLGMCGRGVCDVQTCPHATRTDCSECAMRDALAYIQHLEAKLAEKDERIEALREMME